MCKLMSQTSEQVDDDHIIIGVIVLTLLDNVTKLDTHTNFASHLTPGPCSASRHWSHCHRTVMTPITINIIYLLYFMWMLMAFWRLRYLLKNLLFTFLISLLHLHYSYYVKYFVCRVLHCALFGYNGSCFDVDEAIVYYELSRWYCLVWPRSWCPSVWRIWLECH